ncbi:MAG: CoA:oxalate CoA-transferase [Alphaproteobacteria bacterium]|nr:CoA:oxalate CoA-transferase [Alphaproteobacteria bacterium]
MPETTTAKTGALAGVRVLDFTSYIAGPYATRLMADLGAEIIKLEPPGGDLVRSSVPRRKGKGAIYAQLNAGKKSISVDMTTPEGVDLVLRLIEKCDVVFENNRPGVMKKYGLDYDAVRARKPDIIYASVCGFGQSGPAAELSAYAPIIHAASGWELAKMAIEPALKKPMRANDATADYMSATHAMAAMTAALFRRERTGEGERIDISMLDVMHNVLAFEYQETQFPMKYGTPVNIPIKAKEGFFMIAPVTPKNFDDLLAAIGKPEWKEKFPLNTKAHFEAWEGLMEAMEDWAKDYTAEEAEKIISAGGSPITRFLSMEESMNLPQVAARGSQVIANDGRGDIKMPNTPLRTLHADSRLRPMISEYGQHNDEILGGLLGLKQDELARLRDAKVVLGQ